MENKVVQRICLEQLLTRDAAVRAIALPSDKPGELDPLPLDLEVGDNLYRKLRSTKHDSPGPKSLVRSERLTFARKVSKSSERDVSTTAQWLK